MYARMHVCIYIKWQIERTIHTMHAAKIRSLFKHALLILVETH